MDLKEFITETLGQIAEGVADAQPRAAAVGAVVNPTPTAWPGSGTALDLNFGYHDGAKILMVEISVALSVDKGKGTKRGIGVVTGVFVVGSQGESSEAQASTTHVKFSVPIALPLPKNGDASS